MVNGVVEEKGVAPGAGARPTERGDLLEGITDDAAIVRTRRQMGIWQQHRLGRPGRRKHPRQAPWRGDEGADLCAARHGGHRLFAEPLYASTPPDHPPPRPHRTPTPPPPPPPPPQPHLPHSPP